MKGTLTFKTLGVLDGISDPEMRKLVKQFVEYGEYVYIEFDTETQTATVDCAMDERKIMKRRIIVEVEVNVECDESDFPAACTWAANSFACHMTRYGDGSPWDVRTVPTEARSWRLAEEGKYT